jgi:hypothetical protein
MAKGFLEAHKIGLCKNAGYQSIASVHESKALDPPDPTGQTGNIPIE